MSKEYQVPENTNLFINDTPLDTELVRRAFNKRCCKNDVIVFDRQELTTPLLTVIEDDLAKNSGLGIIFPGQGSQRVKEVLPNEIPAAYAAGLL